MEDEDTHEDNPQPKKSKEAEKAARGVDSVTDRVEEKNVDASKVAEALKLVGSIKTAAPETAESGKTILVTLAAADIQLVMEECEITKDQAVFLLNKSGGDVTLALKKFIQGQ